MCKIHETSWTLRTLKNNSPSSVYFRIHLYLLALVRVKRTWHLHLLLASQLQQVFQLLRIGLARGKSIHVRPTSIYNENLFPKTRFFLQLWKKNTFFSQKMCFFPLLRGKTYFFLTLGPWCQDISWFFPLDDSNPCVDISLGSIPLSTLHLDYTSTLLTLAGKSHKKGPDDALGTCPTTLSVIAVKLESLDEFFLRTTPRSKIETWLYFFIGKKNLDCESPTKSRTQVSKKWTKSSKINRIFSVFHHFRIRTQNMPKKTYLSRTKPI